MRILAYKLLNQISIWMAHQSCKSFILTVLFIRDARRTVVQVRPYIWRLCDGYGWPVHRPSPMVSRSLTEMERLEHGRSTVDGNVRHVSLSI